MRTAKKTIINSKSLKGKGEKRSPGKSPVKTGDKKENEVFSLEEEEEVKERLKNLGYLD